MGQYIEPCCAERQLPALIKRGGFCFFSTNGDVTLDILMKAVSYLAGDSHTLLLSMPSLGEKTLRTLTHYLSRDWMRGCCLLSADTADFQLITDILGTFASQGRVTYACDPLILDSLAAFIGTSKAVVLQGAMLSDIDYSLCHYAAWYGSDASVLQQATDPLIAKLRIKASIHASADAVKQVLSREFFLESPTP